MHCHAIGLECGLWQHFGEEVRLHLVSGALLDIEFMVVVMIPEPVPFAQEVLSSVGNLVIGSKVICALVVFKHTSVDGRSL